jgi:hypothetical protein
MGGSTRLLVMRIVRALTLVLAASSELACSRSTVFDSSSGVRSGTAGVPRGGGASGGPSQPATGASGGASGRGSGAAGTEATAGASGSAGMVSSSGTGASSSPPVGDPNMRACREPSGAQCVNRGDVNFDCGTNAELPPTSGPCAPAGACCHRSSNSAKAPRCLADPLELEYRVTFAAPSNHPLTLGDPLLIASNTARKDRELESLLWRLRLPRGSGVPGGVGDVVVGPGRYNCDGTYSFYGKTAAPRRPGISEDAARWAPRTSRSTIDAGFDLPTAVTLPLASDLVSRERMFMPLLDSARFSLDAELISEGFNFTALVVSDAAQDCIGGREPARWVPGGTYETYMPLAPNDREVIGLISQTQCQLLAFGILPNANKNTTPCATTARCQPGTASCPWRKLPDSLCPDDASERKLFPCHLGDRSNVNREAGYPAEVACSSAAPDSPVAAGAGATLGQCCDPLGSSSSLPPCNAYRVVYDFTAVAVEITEALADTLQQNCAR